MANLKTSSPSQQVKPLAKMSKRQIAARGLREFTFVVTDDALDDAPWWSALTEEQIDEIHAFDERYRRSPGDHLEEAEEMVRRFPEVPKLHQHLSVALEAKGLKEQAYAKMLEIYQRFPDYLFGKTSYVNYLIARGRTDEADAVFQGSYLISDFVGGRTRFHPSEWVTYFVTLSRLLVATDRKAQAQPIVEMLMNEYPNHPLTMQAVLSLCDNPMDLLRGLLSIRGGGKRAGKNGSVKLSRKGRRRKVRK